ncbi:MAG: ribosome silencing factor [Thiomonas sp.]
MDIRKLQRTIVDALEAVKAQDIEVFNTEELTSLFDRVIVASGTSNRQTRALASSVRDSVKAAGFDVRNPEGEETGEWVLVDCGGAVVHIMQPPIRAYYKLEELWGAKPVHLKLGGAKKVGAKVAARGPDSRPDKPEAEATPPARKTPYKTAASKRPAAKKAAAKTAPARTSLYGEVNAEKKRVTRVVGTAAGAHSAPSAPARKRADASGAAPAAKRPAARKTAASSAPAKRPAAKRAAAKTVAAKAPAKRVATKKLAS